MKFKGEDGERQCERNGFGYMMGTAPRAMPYSSHSATPTLNSINIPEEISSADLLFLVRTGFAHARRAEQGDAFVFPRADFVDAKFLGQPQSRHSPLLCQVDAPDSKGRAARATRAALARCCGCLAVMLTMRLKC